MNGWLLDTLLFRYLAMEGGDRKPSFRDWVRRNGESIFLSTISLVEIKTRIKRVGEARRVAAVDHWLKDIVGRHRERILRVDAEVAMRAGALINLRSQKLAGDRRSLFDPLLAATAEIHDLGLLTDRIDAFSPWAPKIEFCDPFELGPRDKHDSG